MAGKRKRQIVADSPPIEMVVKRDESGKFLPGTAAANPGGRPAVAKEFKAWCQEFMTTEGRRNLAQMANDPKSPHYFRANEYLADTAYGKPTQRIAGDDTEAPVAVQYIEVVKMAKEG